MAEADNETKLVIDIAKWVGGVLVALILVFNTVGIIGAGHRGVVYTFGAITGEKTEGLFVKMPFIQGVAVVDCRMQKEQTDAAAASKDLQTVDSTIALNYHIDTANVGTLYRSIGDDFKVRVIDPSIQEATKAVSAKYTAEELITKREQVREEIADLLKTKLAERWIVVDALNIINFNFSSTFNAAIEAKVTAVQKALEAEKKLVQVKFEAEQKVAEAQGKARALQIEGNAISSNPKIVALRRIEAWQAGGSKVPMVIGSNSGFFYNLFKDDQTQEKK